MPTPGVNLNQTQTATYATFSLVPTLTSLWTTTGGSTAPTGPDSPTWTLESTNYTPTQTLSVSGWTETTGADISSAITGLSSIIFTANAIGSGQSALTYDLTGLTADWVGTISGFNFTDSVPGTAATTQFIFVANGTSGEEPTIINPDPIYIDAGSANWNGGYVVPTGMTNWNGTTTISQGTYGGYGAVFLTVTYSTAGSGITQLTSGGGGAGTYNFSGLLLDDGVTPWDGQIIVNFTDGTNATYPQMSYYVAATTPFAATAPPDNAGGGYNFSYSGGITVSAYPYNSGPGAGNALQTTSDTNGGYWTANQDLYTTVKNGTLQTWTYSLATSVTSVTITDLETSLGITNTSNQLYNPGPIFTQGLDDIWTIEVVGNGGAWILYEAADPTNPASYPNWNLDTSNLLYQFNNVDIGGYYVASITVSPSVNAVTKTYTVTMTPSGDGSTVTVGDSSLSYTPPPPAVAAFFLGCI